MRKTITIFRIAAYACSLSGMLLLFIARGLGDGATLQPIGAVLVIAGFATFLVSYALYLVAQLKRPPPRRRPEDR